MKRTNIQLMFIGFFLQIRCKKLHEINAVVFFVEITMKFHYVNGLSTAGSTSHISKSFFSTCKLHFVLLPNTLKSSCSSQEKGCLLQGGA